LAQSNLVTRLVTGLVGIPVILGLLYFGPASGWALFLALALVVGPIGVYCWGPYLRLVDVPMEVRDQ